MLKSTKVKKEANIFTINEGTKKGKNLFHSFDDFSIKKGQEAKFISGNAKYIFARVTGEGASIIDGKISTMPSASLIFLNENGIHFGQNASLSIGRSFLATTASTVKFPGGKNFFSSPKSSTVNFSNLAPIGLQLNPTLASISVLDNGHSLSQGVFQPINRGLIDPGLQVDTGNTIALVGNKISLDGGILRTLGGDIKLLGINSGELGFTENSGKFSFNFNQVIDFGDIYIQRKSLLDASSPNPIVKPGNVELHSSNLFVLDGSSIIIQNLSEQPAGDIFLNVKEKIKIDGSTLDGMIPSNIVNQTLSSGDGGKIILRTSDLSLVNGGQIFGSTFSNGNSGDIDIHTSKSILLDGFVQVNPIFVSNISSSTFSDANSSFIKIVTDDLSITNGSFISTGTFNPFREGNGGDLDVSARIITLSGASRFAPSALGVSVLGNGMGGDLFINTDHLRISDGARIDASNFLSGTAGNISIDAKELLYIDGQDSPFSFESQIIASANNLPPEVRRRLNLEDDIPSGSSGNILISTPKLQMNKAGITVRHDGVGNAGNLRINANIVGLKNQSKVSAETFSGDGGNISLQIKDLLVASKESSISTSANQIGSGGNISISNIDNSNLLLLGIPNENNDIIANAVEGSGGDINISASLIIGFQKRTRSDLEKLNIDDPKLLQTNDVSAIARQSEASLDGTIIFNTPGNDPGQNLSILPENLPDANQIVTQICQNTGTKDSNLVVLERGWD